MTQANAIQVHTKLRVLPMIRNCGVIAYTAAANKLQISLSRNKLCTQRKQQHCLLEIVARILLRLHLRLYASSIIGLTLLTALIDELLLVLLDNMTERECW